MQAYDALLAALVCAIGLRSKRPAVLALVALGAARLVSSPIRLDPPFLFGVQIEQVLAALHQEFNAADKGRLFWLGPGFVCLLLRNRAPCRN